MPIKKIRRTRTATQQELIEEKLLGIFATNLVYKSQVVAVIEIRYLPLLVSDVVAETIITTAGTSILDIVNSETDTGTRN